MTTPIKIISKEEYQKNFLKSKKSFRRFLGTEKQKFLGFSKEIPLKGCDFQSFENKKKFRKPEQEKVWDNISKAFQKREFFKIRKINAVYEFLKDKEGRVIDLGCGAGWNMVPNPKIEYHGVDLSSESIKLAGKNAEKNNIKANLFKGYASKLDKKIFKDNMFDYGLFIAVLHCLDSPAKRRKALKEFYRVLKKGGEGLITVWNSEDERFDCVKNKGDIYMSWKEGTKYHMRYYYLFSKNEFLDLIKSSGFKILEVYSKSNDRFSRKNWIVRVGK